MLYLAQITKPNRKKMIDISKSINPPFLVITLMDLISYRTLHLNKTFDKIVKAGGIHNFLKYKGKIILSLIIKDDMLLKLNYYDYAYIINHIKPDFYTTPDCETYDNEHITSIREIKKSLIFTKRLIELCPNSTPIGHVKGCDEWMVENHTKILKEGLGIQNFIFHVGDFLRHGDPNMITKARNLAFKIRKHAKNLLLYGMGAQNNLIRFSFADVYITDTHFVNAIHRKKFIGTKKIRSNKEYIALTKSNLIEIYNNIIALENQTKLIVGGVCPWVEVQEEKELRIVWLEEK